MGDSPFPYTPPPPSKQTHIPVLYYGLVVVGTAGIVLGIYNLIILRWCSDCTGQVDRSARREGRQLEARGGASSMSFDNPNARLISSFRYKKEGSSLSSLSRDVVVGANDNEYECAVCLSVFEEDEELKQLPRCKHSFHAPCIDMWLYSHLDCPLCRSPVDPPPSFYRVVTTPPPIPPLPRTTGEGLLAGIPV